MFLAITMLLDAADPDPAAVSAHSSGADFPAGTLLVRSPLGGSVTG